MKEKNFLQLDEGVVLALSYEPQESILIVGGNAQFQRQMFMVCTEYFQCDVEKDATFKFTQKNKCRYNCQVSYTNYLAGLKKIEEHNFTLIKTRSLGRVMR